MEHLFLTGRHLDHREASPLYQLLMAADYWNKASILLGGVRAGWLTDPNETGPADLPVLLGYLGTFRGNDVDIPWTQDRLDSQVFMPLDHDPAPDERRERLPAVELALALLDAGANPWATDQEGRDVLDQVNSLMWGPVWERLVQRPDAPNVQAIAQRRQSLGVFEKDGRSLLTLPWLHAAAAGDRRAWLPRLLALGLDVNQRDDLGRTPLFYAASVEVAQVLLDQGADVLAHDASRESLTQAWSKRVRGTELLNSMNRLVQPLIQARFKDDPEALTAQNRPTLYDLMATGTKDAALTFLRKNGFTVNDRYTLDGRTTSLLGHVALQALEQDRSPLLQHLVDRVDDPWFESVPGVPDLMLAWVAGGFDSVERRVEKQLRGRYALSAQNTSEWSRFVQDLVPALERLGDWLAVHRPQGLVGLSTRASHLLRLVTQGRSSYADGKELERWRQEAQANPDLVITQRPQHGSPDRSEIRETLAPAIGTFTTGTVGDPWYWRWAALGVRALEHSPKPETCESIAFGVERLLGRPATPRQAESLPEMPYDRWAVLAMVGLLGNPLSSRAANVGKSSVDGWDASDPVRHGLRTALDDGVPLDSTLPGFNVLFERVRAQLPALYRELEGRLLRQSLADGPDASAPRPRARL